MSHATLHNGDRLQSRLNGIDGSGAFSRDIDRFLSPPQISQKQYAIEQEQPGFSMSKTRRLWGSWRLDNWAI